MIDGKRLRGGDVSGAQADAYLRRNLNNEITAEVKAQVEGLEFSGPPFAAYIKVIQGLFDVIPAGRPCLAPKAPEGEPRSPPSNSAHTRAPKRAAPM